GSIFSFSFDKTDAANLSQVVIDKMAAITKKDPLSFCTTSASNVQFERSTDAQNDLGNPDVTVPSLQVDFKSTDSRDISTRNLLLAAYSAAVKSPNVVIFKSVICQDSEEDSNQAAITLVDKETREV